MNAQARDLRGFFIRLLPPHAIKNALSISVLHTLPKMTLRIAKEKIYNVLSKVHFQSPCSFSQGCDDIYSLQNHPQGVALTHGPNKNFIILRQNSP